MILSKETINDINQLSIKYLDKIVKIRELIHANPELG
jgi:hypothetical protein